MSTTFIPLALAIPTISRYRASATKSCTPEHAHPSGGAPGLAPTLASSLASQNALHAGATGALAFGKALGDVGASRDQSTPIRKTPELSAAASPISTSGSLQKRSRSAARGVVRQAWQCGRPLGWSSVVLQNGSHASCRLSSTCAGAVATPKRNDRSKLSALGYAAALGGGGGGEEAKKWCQNASPLFGGDVEGRSSAGVPTDGWTAMAAATICTTMRGCALPCAGVVIEK